MAVPDDGEGTASLLDNLIAQSFVLQVFMLRVSVELAASQRGPEEWARRFMASLHERIDADEARNGEGGPGAPSHELARQCLDRLGAGLAQVLQLRRR